MKRKNRKFTLIELLVVVAIIAILAAILLPALTKAKERSRRAVCSSQARQIVMALHIYADDHNGIYPRTAADSRWSNGQEAVWFYGRYYAHGMLIAGNYISRADSQVFYCPSWNHPYLQYDIVSDGTKDSQPAGRQGGIPAPDKTGPNGWWVTSYLYRNFKDGDGTFRPLKQTDEDIPLFSDMWARKGSDRGLDIRIGQGYWAHQEGYNVTWLDGHVGWHDDPAKEIMYDAVMHTDHNAVDSAWKDYFEKK